MTYDVIFQLNFTLDGVQYAKMYPQNVPNLPVAVEYTPVNGDDLHAVGGQYLFSGHENYLDFFVGFAHGSTLNNFPATYESLKNNFAPGDKVYDHIHYGLQTQSNKVEIEYRDPQDKFWSSTTYTANNSGAYTAVINQPTAKFTITEMREVKNEKNEDGELIVKGTFNCKLYQINGPGVKELKNGTFVALVGIR